MKPGPASKGKVAISVPELIFTSGLGSGLVNIANRVVFNARKCRASVCNWKAHLPLRSPLCARYGAERCGSQGYWRGFDLIAAAAALLSAQTKYTHERNVVGGSVYSDKDTEGGPRIHNTRRSPTNGHSVLDHSLPLHTATLTYRPHLCQWTDHDDAPNASTKANQTSDKGSGPNYFLRLELNISTRATRYLG